MNTEAIPDSGGSSIELWLSGGAERVKDVALQRGIWDEFGREALLTGADLRVEVTDGTAVLDGVVDHYLAKAVAEGAARRVEGIRAVDSRVRVRPRGAQARSDADVAADAARALEVSALPEGITVHVQGGIVTLRGNVSRAAQRDAAHELVCRLPGVTDVRNELAVRLAPRPDQFEDHLRAAVQREHIRHVAVELRGDIVVLRGRVRSLAQRDRLEHAVWGVPGVTAVADEIEVVA